MLKKFMTVLTVLCATAMPAAADDDQETGDITRGAAFAQRACAECHAVLSEESYSPNPDAPAFQIVAETNGMTRRALVVWLQSSHPNMPNIMLEAQDRDDVVAYIMSLKKVGAM